MTIKAATPYLFFDGNAEQALSLYRETLGARVEGLMRYDQMPQDAGSSNSEPVDGRRIMHALVHLGEAQVMVSDSPYPGLRSPGSNVEVTLDFSDPDEMSRAFTALASGGNVKAAIHDAFWGDKFGALVDRFGIHWMFVHSPSKDS